MSVGKKVNKRKDPVDTGSKSDMKRFLGSVKAFAVDEIERELKWAVKFCLKRAGEFLYFAIAPLGLLWFFVASSIMTGKLNGPADLVLGKPLNVSRTQGIILAVGFIFFAIADVVLFSLAATAELMLLVAAAGVGAAIGCVIDALMFGAVLVGVKAYAEIKREPTPVESKAMVDSLVSEYAPENSKSILSAVKHALKMMKLKFFVPYKKIPALLAKVKNKQARLAIEQAYESKHTGAVATVLQTAKNMFFSPSKVLTPMLAYKTAQEALQKEFTQLKTDAAADLPRIGAALKAVSSDPAVVSRTISNDPASRGVDFGPPLVNVQPCRQTDPMDVQSLPVVAPVEQGQ